MVTTADQVQAFDRMLADKETELGLTGFAIHLLIELPEAGLDLRG